MDTLPLAITAADAVVRAKASNYPQPFAAQMAGRRKQPLGESFGIKNFGMNRCTLPPGAVSALLHRHSRQDEMIYILEGEATLVTDEGETVMRAGMCTGFAAGGRAHRLENRSGADVVLLEVGDRTAGDEASYPTDDLQAALAPDGSWRFAHKDGRPY
ncbi:MAG TPA: cupin [Janthinobacterium sp.]|nr:cupin [Janthinobacterium sp.]